jgi:hypothetical protein
MSVSASDVAKRMDDRSKILAKALKKGIPRVVRGYKVWYEVVSGDIFIELKGGSGDITALKLVKTKVKKILTPLVEKPEFFKIVACNRGEDLRLSVEFDVDWES